MKGLFTLLKRFLKPYKSWVALNIVFNILGAIFGAFSFLALSPILGILFGTQDLVTEKVPLEMSIESIKDNLFYYMSQIIEQGGALRALGLIGIFMIVMVLLKVGFTYLGSFSMITLRNGVVRDIRKKIYQKLLNLPIGYFSDERKGDIMARITGDVTEIENSIMNSLEMFFKNPIIIAVSLTVMFTLSWSLTLFVFAMLPVAAFITGRIGRTLKKPSRKGQDKMGEVLSLIEESLFGLPIIKAFVAEKKMNQRFNKDIQEYYTTMNKLMRRRSLAQPVSEFLGTTIVIVVLWYGGNLILKSESALSAQGFITYLAFFYSIITPAKAFSTALYSVEKGLASLDRVDKILLAENKITNPEHPVDKSNFESEIEFKNVSFSYNEQPILRNVNLKIKKGQTVALVGKSGSGKTTMVNLIPRFWDIDEGEILIDGVNVKQMKLENLRGLLGYVSQEAVLFNDTIENNIAFGIEDYDIETIIEAAKVANAHEFIVKTDDGYFTNIGDRGNKLSGGQRQRLSIARAVMKNPPIMILDEATSALDTESEQLVQEALSNLMRNRTSIVIAHRLSTIKNADVICVMKRGEIVEQGTHDELLEKQGQYYKLHKAQNF